MTQITRSDWLITGQQLCEMDAEEITAVRTAVCSAIATKLLAAPDSKVLAVLGAGVQAGSHIDALKQLYSFDKVHYPLTSPLSVS